MSGEVKIDDLLEEKREEEGTKKEKSTLEKIIFANSKNRPLDEYRTHSFNFDGKESTSRIIRGFEGILGNLDKAIIDILIGTIQKVQEGLKSMQKED